MSESIASRLQNKNIALPDIPPPAANYLPWTIAGSLLFISGQLPLVNGRLAITGRLGDGVTLEEGKKAAEFCAINILAAAKAALQGDLERIVRLAKLQGFVASTPDFTDQHLVINGASDLLVGVLGERGKHARAAVGMAALPLNAAVEIDAVFEVR